jgi:cell division GTPase FtsZ
MRVRTSCQHLVDQSVGPNITDSQKAANESRVELEEALAGADMVFVTVRCLD